MAKNSNPRRKRRSRNTVARPVVKHKRARKTTPKPRKRNAATRQKRRQAVNVKINVAAKNPKIPRKRNPYAIAFIVGLHKSGPEKYLIIGKHHRAVTDKENEATRFSSEKTARKALNSVKRLLVENGYKTARIKMV